MNSARHVAAYLGGGADGPADEQKPSTPRPAGVGSPAEGSSSTDDWTASLAACATAIRDQMNHTRSRLLQGSGEDADRVRKSASGTAKYTMHQRAIAHTLGFGGDHLAPVLMGAFWASEWSREAEQTHRELLRLRYQHAGRIDEEESSIWSQIFKRESGTLGGGLGVGYLHCRCACGSTAQ